MEAHRLLIALTEYVAWVCLGADLHRINLLTICIEFGTISSAKLKPLLTALLEYFTAHSEYMAALLEHIDLKSKE